MVLMKVWAHRSYRVAMRRRSLRRPSMRSIGPVPDDVDDPADHFAIVDTRNAARLVRQERLEARELAVG